MTRLKRLLALLLLALLALPVGQAGSVSFTLEERELTVGVGESFIPRVSDGFIGTLTCRSGNSKMVRVSSETGECVAVSTGTCVVAVSSDSGQMETCKVTVLPRPKKVTLNAEEITLNFDPATDAAESFQMKASVPAGFGGARSIAYSVEAESAEGVIALEDGLVTARNPGWADVCATTYNGLKAYCRVLVPEYEGTLSIGEIPPLGVGQVWAPAIAPKALSGSVTWTCAPQDVAYADPNGHVTAVSEGEAVLTATAFNGQTASARVRVVPAPKSVQLPRASVSLGKGEIYELAPTLTEGSAARLTYSSSDKSVAFVDGEGRILAKKKGEAQITVRTHNGKKATLKVTVKASPSSISFASETLTLDAGSETALKTKLSKGAASARVYESDAPAVAEVLEDGTLRAVAPGTATVTVSTYNGKTASLAVRVVPAAGELVPDMEEETLVLPVGLPVPVPVRAFAGDGTPYEGDLTVSSGKSSVVKVKNGALVGLKGGKTTVTVRAGEKKVSIPVQVKAYNRLIRPMVIAHRGSGIGYPENSLEAYQNVGRTQTDGVEMDVRRTSDGVLVLCHDATVTRTSNSNGFVSRKTYEQLLRIDFHGTKIATLEETLAYLSTTKLQIFVEFKESGVAEDCVELARRYGVEDQVVFFSFDRAEVREASRLAPEIRTAYLLNRTSGIGSVIRDAQKNGVDYLVFNQRVLTTDLAFDVHSAGLKLGAYTVNTARDERKSREFGLDILITDYPTMMSILSQ